MGSRIELQTKLEELLGSRNVYYQSPESVKMSYPAIRYDKERIRKVPANDKTYLRLALYRLTVISPFPDHPVIDKLLELPYSSHTGRHYVVDNLHHDIISLYF